MLAGDVLGGDDALLHGDVGEHQLPGDVADGVDARDVRPHVVVDGDEAALRSRRPPPSRFEPLGVRDEADGDEHGIGFERLLAVFALETATVAVVALDRRRDSTRVFTRQRDAARFERALERAADVRVFERDERVQQLDDGDLRAVARPEVGELDADRAARR